MSRFATTLLCLALAAPAAAEEIVLVSGERLEADVLERGPAGVWLQHGILGRLWVRADQLQSVGGRPLVAPAPPVEAPGTEAAPPADAPPPGPWKFTLEVGASGKSGNSDTSDLHAAIVATQEDAVGRWKAEGIYDYGEADKAKTKERGELRLTRDLKLADSPWFVFATGRVEWDDFQEWDDRVTAGVGAGRTLAEAPDHALRLRVGIQAIRESGSADESWRPEGSLGAEGHWQINAEQRIEGSTTYYPDLEETGERRIESALSWSIKLDNADNLRLKLGIKNEYDSHRTDPFDTNDFQYFAALLYEF
mgnify:CR=1 FL=1